MLRGGANTMVCGSMWACLRIARARALPSGSACSSRTSATTTSASCSSRSTENAAMQPWRTLRGRPFDDGLNVGRVAVDAADDDQVLGPAADEQLAFIQKAQIAGPEIGVVFIARDTGSEGLGAGLGAVPVAAALARSVHPNLADPTVAQGLL